MKQPQSKLAQLRAAWNCGDAYRALQIAARFHDLGPERNAILTAWGALQNPGLYRQMEKNPAALVAAGKAALAARYDLPEER